MASAGQTVRGSTRIESRRHDYLYGNNYAGSRDRDHGRTAVNVYNVPNNVELGPVYRNMFSELRHHPRFEYEAKFRNPISPLIKLRCKNSKDVNRNSSVRFNYDFCRQVPRQKSTDTRCKDVFSHSNFFNTQDSPEITKVRTVGMQTVYRDSETQTDAYSPAYNVIAGEMPELLTLATLSLSLGLPVGVIDLRVIENLRRRKVWEASLPPLSDLSQRDRRRKLLAQIEKEEWECREKEIMRTQETLLELQKKMLKQREKLREKSKISRLDKLWNVKQREKESTIKKIRMNHLKDLNKLTQQRAHFLPSIQTSATNHQQTSTHYQGLLPLTSPPSFMKNKSELFLVRSKHLSTYQGLLELEASLPTFVLSPRLKKHNFGRPRRTQPVQRPCNPSLLLAEIREKSMKTDDNETQPPKDLRMMHLVSLTVSRQQTPQTEMLTNYPSNIVKKEKEDCYHSALTLIQQVIRGRAIQNMMLEGKEKHHDLINELKSTNSLLEGAPQIRSRFLESVTEDLQRAQALHECKESLVSESLADLESKSLGEMMDFLSKEVVRLEEERRIHAFTILCERRRRIREAEESRRRQEEIRRQDEDDEIFKEIIKTHQCSVETYLESIITDSIETVSEGQARREVKAKAEAINNIAYQVHQRHAQLRSDEIVSDLVYSFLIPEVNKAVIRERVRQSQLRFRRAAHKQIYKVHSSITTLKRKNKSIVRIV